MQMCKISCKTSEIRRYASMLPCFYAQIPIYVQLVSFSFGAAFAFYFALMQSNRLQIIMCCTLCGWLYKLNWLMLVYLNEIKNEQRKHRVIHD